jgi:3D (Asp-Asp-Asp) domain-containing protein
MTFEVLDIILITIMGYIITVETGEVVIVIAVVADVIPIGSDVKVRPDPLSA